MSSVTAERPALLAPLSARVAAASADNIAMRRLYMHRQCTWNNPKNIARRVAWALQSSSAFKSCARRREVAVRAIARNGYSCLLRIGECHAVYAQLSNGLRGQDLWVWMG